VNVAVIPARGGSKRIHKKNIREFAGQPMIAHSIRCALGSGLFDRVIVSTDDDEIAAVALAHGAEVPFRRPPELADDHTGTIAVIAHATDWLQQEGMSVSAVCCIYATAPFIRTEDVKQGLALIVTGRWQYVFSATTFGFPILRSFKADPDGAVEMFFPEYFSARSQDMQDALHDAAQFYWGLPTAWLSGSRMFDRTSTVVRIPRWRVQDIDTEEDWARAEAMAAYLRV